MSGSDLKGKFEQEFEHYLKDTGESRPRMRDSIEIEHNYMLYMKSRFWETLSLLNKSFDRKVRILDVGTSPFTYMIKDILGHDVFTIDLSSAFEEYSGRRGVVFKECDMTRQGIPFDDNSFDAILFNEVLEHLAVRSESLLKELHRVLDGSGLLMIQTPNFTCLYNRIKFLFGFNVQESAESMLGYPKYGSGHFREYTMRECMEMLKRSESFSLVMKKYAFYNDRPSTLLHYMRHPISEKKPSKVFMTGIPVYSLFAYVIPSFRRSILIMCRKR
jgi:SAM-dependent methyltransferase